MGIIFGTEFLTIPLWNEVILVETVFIDCVRWRKIEDSDHVIKFSSVIALYLIKKWLSLTKKRINKNFYFFQMQLSTTQK